MVGGQRHGSAALLTGKGPGILVRLHMREILNIHLDGGSLRKKAKRDPAIQTLCFNYKWMMGKFQNRRYVGI